LTIAGAHLVFDFREAQQRLAAYQGFMRLTTGRQVVAVSSSSRDGQLSTAIFEPYRHPTIASAIPAIPDKKRQARANISVFRSYLSCANPQQPRM
jgi:hypothetical protein